MNNYLNCYINLISDKNNKIIIKSNDEFEKTIKFKKFKNIIFNSHDYIINNDKIVLTSSF